MKNDYKKELDLKINPLNTNLEKYYYDGELKISEFINQIIKDKNLPENVDEYLAVFINGYEVPRDLWPYTKIKSDQNVLVSVIAKGGSFGQILKVAAIALVAYAAPGIGTSQFGFAAKSFGLGLFTVGSTIGASLLLNALIPPPSLGGMGAARNEQEDSQMYSITSQSNALKKYGTIPKVYGRHKIFPTVAASPYTEIEADPESGDLVQYFYAVYDLGFGPLQVENIRIGDTSISDYEDVEYRLVDFNKPKDVDFGTPVVIIEPDPLDDPDVVTFDQSVEDSPEKTYGIAYNLDDGGVRVARFQHISANKGRIFVDSNDLRTPQFPRVGDFVSFGEYHLVGKEPIWDSVLTDELTHYKGDVNQEDIGVGINENKFDGAPEDEYQVIRNASFEGDGDDQEITINLVCPRGLHSYNTAGAKGNSNVEIICSFAEEGTENWRAHNDPTFVKSSSVVGGQDRGGYSDSFDPWFEYTASFDTTSGNFYNGFNPLETDKMDGCDLLGYSAGSFDLYVPPGELIPGYKASSVDVKNIPAVYNEFIRLTQYGSIFLPNPPLSGVFDKYAFQKRSYGYKRGRTKLYSWGVVNNGAAIHINGYFVGNCLGSFFTDGRYEITLDRPLDRDITLFYGYRPIYQDYLRPGEGTNKNDYYGVDRFLILESGGHIRTSVMSTTASEPVATEDGRYFMRPISGRYIYGRPYPEKTVTDESSRKPFGSTFLQSLEGAGKILITGDSTNPVYSTIKIVPKESKNYKVRIQRIQSYSQYTFREENDLTFLNIVTRFDRKPITTEERHVFLELKIRATNQLNGTISNLSAVCESVLDVWNGSEWVKQPTNNPAWVYADLLTGRVNKRSIDKTRLDTPSLLSWADYCDEIPTSPPNRDTYINKRFECNFVLDFGTTLQSLINQVTGAAQASLNIIDGKYGVLVDQKKDIPVQIFTPRNSFNFSSKKAYFEPPHAVKIKYVAPGNDWSVSEEIVYSDGYDVSNAEKFDELESFACTNNEQAFRYGRYMQAQSKLRLETISLDVDFEHLVCTRGDYVRISQDVMKVGGTAARVKSIDPAFPNRITLDESIDHDISENYGYTYRNYQDGIGTSTCTILTSNTIEVDGPVPSKGDIIIVGIVDSVWFDCIVKSIFPSGDLNASLTLVEKADAIYDAESSANLPDYDPQIAIVADPELSVPGQVRNLTIDENTYECTGYDYRYYMVLTWNVPKGSSYEKFEIYLDDGAGYNIIAFSDKSEYEYTVPKNKLGIEHSFKVLAVSATGKKLTLNEAVSASDTPVEKNDPPSDVSSIDLNITGEVLQISWTRITDCDALEYLIRYNPSNNGTWETSIPLLRVDKNTSLASTQARTGSYLIKAVDFNGNESSQAAIALTTIPELFNLNVIDETNDFPSLPGGLNQVVKSGNGLLLQEISNGDPNVTEYYSDGYYYYANFLDLGDIFTVRLQSLIEAEGFTVDDIMSNWLTLDQVPYLSQARQSEWDVRTEVRYTSSFNNMAQWVTLSSIDRLSEGVEDNWSDWKDFSISDFTARIFQFRLKLISNKSNVTPRVFDGKIKADMPDRTVNIDNESIPVGGKTINIDPAFKGPSTGLNIQITIDNGQSGDYHSITNRGLDSFDLEILDKNDASVSRSVDIQIKGFGRSNQTVV